MSRAWKKWVAIGSLLLLAIPTWQWGAIPEIVQIPNNLDITTRLVGKVGILNATEFDLDYNDVTILLHIYIIATPSPDIVVMGTKALVYDAHTGNLMPDIYQQPEITFAVDRKTFKYVSGHGDREVEGYWTFPVGALEKRTYTFFDFTLNKTVPVNYVGEGMRGGINTWIYRSNVDYAPLPSYYMNLSFYYSAETTYYVEPNSGIVVDAESDVMAYVHVPDLTVIPTDYKMSSSVSGKLKIINTSYFYPSTAVGGGNILKTLSEPEENIMLEYNITSIGTGAITGSVDNDSVAMIQVTTVTYNSDTGEPLPDIYQAPVIINAVDRMTFKHNPSYGDKARNGHFIFKLGVPLERRIYSIWTEEINDILNISYTGEEERGGINTYMYEGEVKDYLINGSMYGIELPPNSELRYNGRFKYWIEPKSAIIIDNYRYSNVTLIDKTTGIGKTVFVLETQHTPEKLAEVSYGTILYNNLLPKSNNLMPVLHIHLSSSPESLNYHVEESTFIGSVLLFVKYGVPGILIIVGSLVICIGIYTRKR